MGPLAVMIMQIFGLPIPLSAWSSKNRQFSPFINSQLQFNLFYNRTVLLPFFLLLVQNVICSLSNTRYGMTENMGDGSEDYENIIPWWNKLPAELAYKSNNWLFVQLLPFCLEAPGNRELMAELSLCYCIFVSTKPAVPACGCLFRCALNEQVASGSWGGKQLVS